MNKKLPIYLLLGLFIAGCASSRKIVKEEPTPPISLATREVKVWSSHETPPAWIYTEIESDEIYYYFTGISDNHKNEKDARYSAFKDGIAKVTNYIGVEVSVIYESLKASYNLSTEIIDPTMALDEKQKELAEAFFSKFKVQNWYLERYEVQRTDGTLVDTYWKAYVKACIPKKEVEEASAKIKELREKTLNPLTSVEKLPIKDVKVIILVSEKILGKESDESIVGNELSSRLIETGYRVIGFQDISKTNVEKLEKALQKDMLFSVKDEYVKLADFIVSGNCSTRPGVENPYNMISVVADAYIKVISLKTGEIIAQKNVIGTAGFGLSQEQAAVNALKRAAKTIAEKIIEQME
ncbi:MAG: hypothetical protein ABIF11_10045 [Nitrospirota bacterium]